MTIPPDSDSPRPSAACSPSSRPLSPQSTSTPPPSTSIRRTLFDFLVVFPHMYLSTLQQPQDRRSLVSGIKYRPGLFFNLVLAPLPSSCKLASSSSILESLGSRCLL
ncbi:hypothetical protein PM082_014558 [Marasmius tenuissimus]|nr:hypothetical protein PM082_014558 [Marasmius tenuissimus]